MARIKLTEYRAKRILLGDAYRGMSVPGAAALPRHGRWVAKVDEGVKKRAKRGLVAVDQPLPELSSSIAAWKKAGFGNFLLEPFVPHDASEERYLSLERVREGVRILYAREGGIDVEEHPEKVRVQIVRGSTDIADIARDIELSETFLRGLLAAFDEHFLGFLEINPLVVQGENVFLLDAAALVDSAGAFFTRAWGEADCVRAKHKHDAEARVEALDASTPASLKLNVLNPDGSLFFLLSAGGGSIVIADQAQLLGAGKDIGNYGEYSGGPTREETYLYAKEVVRLLLDSKAKKKALVIAGPVANFTDVKKTFLGIVDALSESSERLRKAGVRVFVRRGGPNEAAGLALMEEFLKREGLFGSLYGSDAPITAAVEDAISFLKTV